MKKGADFVEEVSSDRKNRSPLHDDNKFINRSEIELCERNDIVVVVPVRVFRDRLPRLAATTRHVRAIVRFDKGSHSFPAVPMSVPNCLHTESE